MKNRDLKPRNWTMVHELEDRGRILSLGKKSAGGRFHDFCELYQMAADSMRERDLSFFADSKSKVLSRIHRCFKRLPGWNR